VEELPSLRPSQKVVHTGTEKSQKITEKGIWFPEYAALSIAQIERQGSRKTRVFPILSALERVPVQELVNSSNAKSSRCQSFRLAMTDKRSPREQNIQKGTGASLLHQFRLVGPSGWGRKGWEPQVVGCLAAKMRPRNPVRIALAFRQPRGPHAMSNCLQSQSKTPILALHPHWHSLTAFFTV
jgi:hypothetical protein